jgi:hypothetical protein
MNVPRLLLVRCDFLAVNCTSAVSWQSSCRFVGAIVNSFVSKLLQTIFQRSGLMMQRGEGFAGKME